MMYQKLKLYMDFSLFEILVGGSIASKFSKTQNQTNKTNETAATNTNTENVARIRTVKRKNQAEKKSTGCGPSPPKEIEPKKTIEMEKIIEPKAQIVSDKKGTTSTGTSPLPQSISTQVSLKLCI